MTDFENSNLEQKRNHIPLIVNRVEGTGKSAAWTKIGVGFPHKDSKGFDLILNGIEKDLRLCVRQNEPRSSNQS